MEIKVYETLPEDAALIRREVFMEEQGFRDEFDVTILLIDHHMDLIMDISDRVYVIDFGKQIAHGTPEEIQNDQRVIDAYLGVEEDA